MRERPMQSGASPVDAGRLASVVLGAGLSPEVERRLLAAGRSCPQDELADRHLREARALAPDHVAALIGLYRFYFYKNRLRKAARDNSLSLDWHDVRASDANFDCFGARVLLGVLERLGQIDDD